MDDPRVFLTPEQAIAMLPDGDTVHTFLDGPFLIGADWDKSDVIDGLKAAPENGIELTGPMAAGMGHGLCFQRDSPAGTRTVFVETKPQEEPKP